MSQTIKLQTLSGETLCAHIPVLARLRIEVFREFPYLYDGDQDYEARYLQRYIEAPGGVIVLAFAGDEVVGASTDLPLAQADPAFQRPFVEQGYDPATVFYLGESVLLAPYRGRGIGVRFFIEREAHARRTGDFRWSAFCAVARPAGHPRRPPDYRPLDAFWSQRGYQQHPELSTRFRWKDLDEAGESEKIMRFWLKPLREAD